MRPFRNNQKRIRNRNIQDRSFKRSNDMNRLILILVIKKMDLEEKIIEIMAM